MKIDILKLRQVNNHISALSTIAKCSEYEAIKLYMSLRRLETRQHRWNENDCNGEPNLSESEEEKRDRKTKYAVKKLIPSISGFFINGDPRGYALKIKSELVHLYPGLYTDFGGFGILAPEF